MLTPEQIKDKLLEAIKKAGGQRAWARAHGVSEQYVCDAVQGRRGIGEKLAHPLGYRLVTRYEPKAKSAGGRFAYRARVGND